jgi:hypothetical protein
MSNPTQERRHARARTEILESAARAFAKKGFHGTSVDDVAREAGMSPSSLYRYFERQGSALPSDGGQHRGGRPRPIQLTRSFPRCPLTNGSSGCCAASWRPSKHSASSSSRSRRNGPPWTGNWRAQETPSATPIIAGWRRFERSSKEECRQWGPATSRHLEHRLSRNRRAQRHRLSLDSRISARRSAGLRARPARHDLLRHTLGAPAVNATRSLVSLVAVLLLAAPRTRARGHRPSHGQSRRRPRGSALAVR